MIICFAGKAGSGKDTCADMLCEQGFEKIAFADALRDVCSTALNIKKDYFINRDKKDKIFIEPFIINSIDLINLVQYLEQKYKYKLPRTNVERILDNCDNKELRTPRQILQFVGTQVFRKHFRDDLWIDIVKNKCLNTNNIIITDCRFLNERTEMKKIGSVNILIKRPFLKTIDDHISENDLGLDNEYDFVVFNNKTLLNLEFELQRILKTILQKVSL